jgi:hypothetical protein
MSKKLKIHFTNKNTGGNKNIFKLFDDNQLNINYKISTISFLKMFENMMKKNNRNNINNNINNNVNINISKNIYNKGSETKKYYEQLKTK